MTRDEAIRRLKVTARLIGPSYHCDTPAREYLKTRYGDERLFSDSDAKKIDDEMIDIFLVLGDEAYNIACDEIEKMMRCE